jgi:disulfide bond formation protein DsbB
LVLKRLSSGFMVRNRVASAFGPPKTLQCDRASSRQDSGCGIRRFIQEATVTLNATASSSYAPAPDNPALSAALAITAIAAATLAGAWFFQLVLDIRPCPLCLEQRYAYYLAIPLGALLAFAAARDTRRSVLLAGLAILAAAALGNAWLGAYHAGVEWKFWQGPTDCSGPIVNLGSAGNLLERLETTKVIRCDDVQWRFLGLSLAGYNVLISRAGGSSGCSAAETCGLLARRANHLLITRSHVKPSKQK